MLTDWHGLAIAQIGIFILSFMKGAFGGGMAILGIPILSLGMDPITAGALLAPIFIAADICAFRYWRPSTWSRPDAAVLLPSLVIGIGLGSLMLALIDHRLVAIVIAVTTLGFCLHWFLARGIVASEPRSIPLGLLAGTVAGITTMLAHAGGPPLAMYLLRRGLPKAIYAGTTSLFFTVGNVTKAGPWLMLVDLTPAFWKSLLICLPVVPVAVWAGWRLHERLNQVQLYRVCYALLALTALKLLWDGMRGFQ